MARNIVSGLLREGLYTRVVGRRLVYLQRIPSTMDEAARLAQEGAEDGTVVVAEEQTAGRGRFQREWVSQPGNLYFSILLKPPLHALPYLSIISGVAVARAIRKTTGLAPAIKWPNDVRIRGRKVCGILVEDAVQEDEVQYAVVGIGVNVALEPSAVEGLAHIATSLNLETGRPVDREGLLRHLLQEMDSLYLALRQAHDPSRWGAAGQDRDMSGLKRAMAEWRGLLDTLGRHVEVRWQDEVHTGYAEDVDDLGNLLLRGEDGALATLAAGEVTTHLS